MLLVIYEYTTSIHFFCYYRTTSTSAVCPRGSGFPSSSNVLYTCCRCIRKTSSRRWVVSSVETNTKHSPRWRKIGPRWTGMGSRWPEMRPRGPKMAQNTAQMWKTDVFPNDFNDVWPYLLMIWLPCVLWALIMFFDDLYHVFDDWWPWFLTMFDHVFS
jgi:hypothetical protein